MNRHFFINLTVAAMVIAVAFTSCQKDDNDKVKLLETVKEPYGQYHKFEYDSQNRLAKYSKYNSDGELLETRTHTYSGNDLVKVMFNSTVIFEYTKSGNKITATPGTQTWDLNSDGQLVKYEMEIGGNSQIIDFQNHKGNIVKRIYVYNHEAGETDNVINEYKYDNKKSPMYNCTTPQWYLIYSFIDLMIGTKNNMIEQKWKWNADSYTDEYEYKYEYDSDGYPTKRISNSNGNKEVTEYVYIVVN